MTVNPLEIRAAQHHDDWVTWIKPRRAAEQVNAELLADEEELERQLDAAKAERDAYQRQRDKDRLRELKKLAGQAR